MNIIIENLHCIGAVGRERATLEGFKTRGILVDVNGVTEKLPKIYSNLVDLRQT